MTHHAHTAAKQQSANISIKFLSKPSTGKKSFIKPKGSIPGGQATIGSSTMNSTALGTCANRTTAEPRSRPDRQPRPTFMLNATIY